MIITNIYKKVLIKNFNNKENQNEVFPTKRDSLISINKCPEYKDYKEN